MNIDFEAIAFVIMSLLAILGALGCVYSRRVAHSLLSLMMTFFAVAGCFRFGSGRDACSSSDSSLPRFSHVSCSVWCYANSSSNPGR